jgi:predicted nucleotidyltransferase
MYCIIMNKDLSDKVAAANVILRSYGATEVHLFGSAANGTMREDSDVDIAVRGISPEKFFSAMAAASEALNRNVDLVDLDSKNPISEDIRKQMVSKHPPRLREYLDNEFANLSLLLDSASPLLQKVSTSPPDNIEIMAVAALLHSFYTGIESAFKRIAMLVDETVPAGEFSHTELLRQMSRPTQRRLELLSAGLSATLQDYLRFRHFFRHAYTYHLDWSQMSQLAQNCRPVLEQLKSAAYSFLADYENRQSSE